ncbi:hypothetical protein, partial [Bosea sp. (in: a-proteobacteria)]|uniref:hypothetical protein n=1 Tax=Bosea sp. (in: a-proteobacteria) TaxID=1871050 RepID=UPI004034DEE9
MLTTVAICAQMLTTICLNMDHTTRPTKKDSDRCLNKHRKRLGRLRATIRTISYNIMTGMDGTIPASNSLCKLIHRFHLSTHGANSSHPHTVYQYNSTLHVYCCYQTATHGLEAHWATCIMNNISAALAVYVAWLLLAAGDVEANPGPASEHYQQARHSFD